MSFAIQLLLKMSSMDWLSNMIQPVSIVFISPFYSIMAWRNNKSPTSPSSSTFSSCTLRLTSTSSYFLQRRRLILTHFGSGILLLCVQFICSSNTTICFPAAPADSSVLVESAAFFPSLVSKLHLLQVVHQSCFQGKKALSSTYLFWFRHSLAMCPIYMQQ